MRENKRDFPPFASVDFVKKWLIRFLYMMIVIYMGNMISLLLFYYFPDLDALSELQAMAIGSFVSVFGISFLLGFLGTAILFLKWIHLAYSNSCALGAIDLQYSPGWAAAMFLVPIFNLYMPYRVVNEIWQASNPNVSESTRELRKRAKVPGLIVGWWAFWLLSNFISSPALGDSLLLGTISALLSIAATVLAISVISKINDLQAQKHGLFLVKQRDMVSHTA